MKTCADGKWHWSALASEVVVVTVQSSGHESMLLHFYESLISYGI
jgi:hypothetical protein